MMPPRKCRTIALFAVLFLGFVAAWPASAAALDGPAQPASTERVGRPCSPPNSDLSLDSDVHMDSIKFDVVPRHALLRTGGKNERGGYTIRRTNIPKHPQPGVTYKNVRVQLHLASTLVDPHTPSIRC